jgi:hypothetical protein
VPDGSGDIVDGGLGDILWRLLKEKRAHEGGAEAVHMGTADDVLDLAALLGLDQPAELSAAALVSPEAARRVFAAVRRGMDAEAILAAEGWSAGALARRILDDPVALERFMEYPLIARVVQKAAEGRA